MIKEQWNKANIYAICKFTIAMHLNKIRLCVIAQDTAIQVFFLRGKHLLSPQ